MAVRLQGNISIAPRQAWRRRRAKCAQLLLASSLIFSGIGLLPTPGEALESTTAALPVSPRTAGRQAELPAVLSPADATAYRKIFSLQQKADWTAADQEITKLKERRLVGHVMAQRYLHPQFKAAPADLAAWLSQYADHPDATAIYRLAERRVPKGRLTRPVGESLNGGGWAADDLGPPPDPPAPSARRLAGNDSGRAAALKSQVRRALRAGDLAGAEKILVTRDGGRLLSDGEYDHFKAQIAAGWFAQGEEAKALELAHDAAARSGAIVPRANWVAGLAHFRQGKYREAASHFEALARTRNGAGWDIAAGAFWAARAHARDRRFDLVNHWLSQAAEYPRTFYGLMAMRQLGVASPFQWEAPALTDRDVEAIQRLPAGARAFALIQVGQSQRAEAELRRVYAAAGPGQMRPLLSIAMRANLPGLTMRLGRELADFDGRRHDGSLYPIPPWTPTGGYQIDRALLFAFMRQESQFNARAVSPAGARGLMQLMPQTAAYIDGQSFRGRADQLLDPVYNVTLGQRYISELLQHEFVQGDLIRLAAAYNGGPGNLARWSKKQDRRNGGGEDDALLFIESLPSPETRHFITRLLYSYWMYSDRLGQATPSLDDIAAGRWPTYIALETEKRVPRRNAQNR